MSRRVGEEGRVGREAGRLSCRVGRRRGQRREVLLNAARLTTVREVGRVTGCRLLGEGRDEDGCHRESVSEGLHRRERVDVGRSTRTSLVGVSTWREVLVPREDAFFCQAIAGTGPRPQDARRGSRTKVSDITSNDHALSTTDGITTTSAERKRAGCWRHGVLCGSQRRRCRRSLAVL